MEKITNILNNKQNKENYDSCYLSGKTNIKEKNSSSNNTNINKIDFLKTGRLTETKFYSTKKSTHLNLNKKNFDESLKKNQSIKVLTPNNKDFVKNLNNFDYVYRDSYLNRIPMHFSNDNQNYKQENKIFNERVKKEINCSNNIKNNYMIFYEQLNISKNKIKNNEKDYIDTKINLNKETAKEDAHGKKSKFLKLRDPESTNLFLTKLSLQTKNISEKIKINKVNLDKLKIKYDNNCKDVKSSLIDSENLKNEFDNNVSQSIKIENDENDFSFVSLKNEFSFLLEKKDEKENYMLRDIINDVKLAQNKIKYECDDIKNLLRYASDTKSILQIHKTENKFFNIKNKKNIEKAIIKKIENINNNDFPLDKDNFSGKIHRRKLSYDVNKNKNNTKNMNKEHNLMILNNISLSRNTNQNSFSVDKGLFKGENQNEDANQKKLNFHKPKTSDKKRSLTETNFQNYLPNNFDNLEKLIFSVQIFIIHKPFLGSCELPQKCWARFF